DGRLQVGTARRGTPVDDDAIGRALDLVGLLAHRGTLDQILEVDSAVDLGEDGSRVRVPLRQARAALDRVALVHEQTRTVGDLVRGQLPAGLVDDADRHRAAHRDQAPLAVAHDVAVLDPHRAVEVRLDEGRIDHLRRTADVEGAHRELRAWLADRLGRNDADGLTDVDRRAACQIAAVALGADARHRLAGQHRTDANLLDLGSLDGLGLTLLDQLACGDDDLAGRWIDDVLSRRTAQDTVAQRDH